MPLVDDLMVAMPAVMPGFSHLTLRSPYARCTVTVPGVVTNQVPLSFSSLQVAPSILADCCSVSTETTWLVPLTIEAQPVRLLAATTAMIDAIIRTVFI